MIYLEIVEKSPHLPFECSQGKTNILAWIHGMESNCTSECWASLNSHHQAARIQTFPTVAVCSLLQFLERLSHVGFDCIRCVGEPEIELLIAVTLFHKLNISSFEQQLFLTSLAW